MSLKKNTIFNILGFGVPAIVGIVSIPFLVTRMGLEAFGVFTLIGTIIGYLSIFDLGLGSALTQQIAAKRANGSSADLAAVMRAGLLLTLLIGSFGGILIFCFARSIAEQWLGVSPTALADAEHALVLAAIAIPITTATSALRGIQEGYENFKIVNVLRVAQGSLNFLLPLFFVYYIDNTVSSAVLSILILRVFVFAGYANLPGIFVALFQTQGGVSVAGRRTLVSTGAWMTVSNVVSPLMVTCDRFFISSMLGAGVVSIYTIPLEALLRLLILPSAISSALFPKLALLESAGGGGSNDLYKKAYSLNFVSLFVIAAAFAMNAEFILRVWISQEFAQTAAPLFTILTIGIFFNGVAHVPYAAIQARGNAKATGILRASEAIIYVPVLMLCVTHYQLVGVAFAWTGRALVDLVALHIIELRSRRAASDANPSCSAYVQENR